METPAASLTSALGAAIAGLVGGAVLRLLVERENQWLNRYQIAVATEQPVTEITQKLETLEHQGIVRSTGGSPNRRSYQLTQRAAKAIAS